MLNATPKHSGIYFIKDNINNLQFKINFRSINTLLKLPEYTVAAYNSQESHSTPDEENDVFIKWQQKIFSFAECQLYGDLKNCSTDQQRKYHGILKEKQRCKRQTKRKKQRKPSSVVCNTENEGGSFIFTYVHEDNFSNSNDLHKNTKATMKQWLAGPCEEMLVYAALSPDTELAVLRWFKQDRLLYIYPDFTQSQDQFYFIDIDTDYRHLYSYGIQDVSLKAFSPTDCEEEFIFLPELSTHWHTEDGLTNKFDMPPRRTQRCAIIFTLNDAFGFEYENIHVRYHIKLPDNTILEEGLLNATSHSTSTSHSHLPAHIGLSWQITILCEEQFDPGQYLRIYFEIISIDSWERERIEGFCHYSVNLLTSSNQNVKLNCIRPVETIFESIRRYFIGGRRQFDYQSFICGANEEDADSNFYCRYGEHMQNSGQLTLSCQILSQRSCELLSPCASRTSGMTLDDIMKSYKEARRRLEALTLS